MESPETLYKKYHNKIYNLALRMTGNQDAANDITHDTFLQAFKSIEKFRGESQPYTWLYKIAKNNCLKFLEKRDHSTVSSLQELIDKNSSPVSEEVTEAEKMNYILQVKDGCLLGLLRCLSLQQRLAFILNVLLDLPLTQVASIIEKSENATRILVHRSRQNIKEFLCSNCSLYDPRNACRCENLINFSLKQGWIGLNNQIQVESEIKELKNEISLYKTLQDKSPTSNIDKQIQQLLAEMNHSIIFNDKKVK
jgi:RNA polymerase sigma-70 factor (ECF subfamily)